MAPRFLPEDRRAEAVEAFTAFAQRPHDDPARLASQRLLDAVGWRVVGAIDEHMPYPGKDGLGGKLLEATRGAAQDARRMLSDDDARPFVGLYTARLAVTHCEEQLAGLREVVGELKAPGRLAQLLPRLREGVFRLASHLEQITEAPAELEELIALTARVRTLVTDDAAAFAELVRTHEARLALWGDVKQQAHRLSSAAEHSAVVPDDAVRQVARAAERYQQASRDAGAQFGVAGGPGSLLAEAAERLQRRHERCSRVVAQLADACAQAMPRLEQADAITQTNRQVWEALLAAPNLVGDTALLRNIRNLVACGVDRQRLLELLAERPFRREWPHQIYAGFKAEPSLEPFFEVIMRRMVARLPAGRHLGIADASGSMTCTLGGPRSTVTCMDVAFCFTALMSETSGLGASFSDGTWGPKGLIALAQRDRERQGVLAFSQHPELAKLMGGTQVFGAIVELVVWLEARPEVAPPECLWFFSDMQFHPADGAIGRLPEELQAQAVQLGLGRSRPPLELALDLYRQRFGKVDVVLWNLAAYSPIPVPADMEGVLLVSGFDANTFQFVGTWRGGGTLPDVPAADARGATAEENAELILEAIRKY